MFLQLSDLKFEKVENRPSATKPSRLMFRLQVQVPTTVNELTLSAYNCLICYKLSDDDMSRFRLVVTDGALAADVHCPELLKRKLFQESD